MGMKTQKAISKVRAVDELVTVFDSKLFKSLGEPVRVQILKFLMLNGRADIGTIAEKMPQDRSVISRHLNLMHEAGILTCEKESRHMFYDVDGQAFMDKLENITGKIRECMAEQRCPL
jgi:DNA-binding transcriptional ArsR family regulator